MRILSYGHSQSGCWWIRIRTPFNELAKKHLVMLTDGKKQVTMNGWQIVVFNNILGDIEKIEDGKVVKSSIEEVVQTFKANGAKIVYDTDDAQDIHPHKDEKRSGIEEHLDSYFYLLKNADLITTTTEQLKEHLQQFTDRPIKVLPNCIDPDLFPKRKKENKIKIGFAGSDSHIPDLEELIVPVIKKLKEKYDIYFETFGFQVGTFKWKRPKPVWEYYKGLSELGADIAICPLRDTQFNRSKSPLKFLEYSMVGSAVLASKRYPYVGEMKEEWLVEDDQWYEKLEQLILDKKKKEEIAQEQKTWVLENRDIKDKVKEWEKAYRELIS